MRLHEACLAGFGMPLGELFDLEAIAAVSEKIKRWTFYLTVCPLNIKGGIATVANTMAIFQSSTICRAGSNGLTNSNKTADG
jgi:hypothetical protein